MLMKSPTPLSTASGLAGSLDSVIGRLRFGATQLYRSIKHRHHIAALADQDDYLLADIGLTREDVRYAVAQPLWRDPTVTLQQRAGAARRVSLDGLGCAGDRNRRALAALDDSDVANLSDLGRRMRRDARRQLAAACLLAAGFVACLGASPAMAQPVCKPGLAITDVQFSPMHPETLQRKWTALVSVDASRCAANAGGTFDIGFSRLKENAPDEGFSERFQWKAPSVKVDVDFWADEAVERYWLGRITPCACRD